LKGASIARKFAKAYPVVVLARNPNNYDAVVQEINSSGGKAYGISTDVSDSASVKSAFDKITKELFPNTPLAAAVFNLGGGFVRKPFLELTEDEFAVGYNTQTRAGFLFSQASLPLLLSGLGVLELPPTLIFTGMSEDYSSQESISD
jgi:NAD(P)-dependent dehydrogenase (short-subunit alcohol dehydrogenase family)